MNRLKRIRREEKLYHDQYFKEHTLFEQGTWLEKPVKTVMEYYAEILNQENPRVLDLGCGVGRNSIPIAQKMEPGFGKVVCVDLLESAIEKIMEYSRLYHVEEIVEAVQADIGDFYIKENEYDYIFAVSSLEHVSSEQVLDYVLEGMAEGTKAGGINCIIINTDIEESLLDTREIIDPGFEVNIQAEKMLLKLNGKYQGWQVLYQSTKPMSYQINRGEKKVSLQTNVATYVVQKI
ncbi:MAG: methyltransferase protein [Herbinix sp.]|jgi:2-polyprenyl-3-methyl-5-hydroxy-6-metoxy-1,4-benzoquinol methylase|nr:methyltransferase protein [Herbinix sp.]